MFQEEQHPYKPSFKYASEIQDKSASNINRVEVQQVHKAAILNLIFQQQLYCQTISN